MAEFLSTKGVAHLIEDIIKKSTDKIYILSPYLQISTRFLQRLADADRKGKQIILVYKENKLNPAERRKLLTLKSLQLYGNDDLHAKCYLNEELAVVTSLNMIETSESKNWEMGVLFSKEKDSSLYEEVLEEVLDIINASKLIKNTGDYDSQKGSQQKSSELNEKQLALMKTFSVSFGIRKSLLDWDKDFSDYGLVHKLNLRQYESNNDFNSKQFQVIDFFGDLESTYHIELPEKTIATCNSLRDLFEVLEREVDKARKAVGSDQIGYCIRDGVMIPYNPRKPLGSRAYAVWSNYNDPYYEEEFCHQCGELSDTSVARPLCLECFRNHKGDFKGNMIKRVTVQ